MKKSLEREERILRYYTEGVGERESMESVMVSRVLARGRFFLTLMLFVLFFVPVFICECVLRRSPRRVWRVFSRCLCWGLGVKVEVKGEREGGGDNRVVYVSNHVSYLDIAVLRSCGDVRFVARGDMRDWPILGVLSRFNETLFFARRGVEAKAQVKELAGEIRGKGMDIVIFPEGTTGGGVGVLDFKSSLFQGIVESVGEGKREVYIQPVSLNYCAINNTAMTQLERNFVSWVGDEGFYPHIERCLGLGCITVEVTYHPAKKVEDESDRKSLALWSEKRVKSVWEGRYELGVGKECES